MGLFNLFKQSSKVIVIDGLSLNESLGSKGKVPPRNQLQILRRLSRFAQREKLEVVVVLTGSPLHKAPARKKFEEVTVLYSKGPDAHARYMAATARSKGSGAVLVTGNSAIDKLVGKSVLKMRMSTFRKAFDSGGIDVESSERNSGNRNSRKPRRRPQKPAAEKNKETPQKPKAVSEADAINELIDLVD